jgi:hypothetical protein
MYRIILNDYDIALGYDDIKHVTLVTSSYFEKLTVYDKYIYCEVSQCKLNGVTILTITYNSYCKDYSEKRYW